MGRLTSGKWTTGNNNELARSTNKSKCIHRAPESQSAYTMKRFLRLEIPVDTYPNVCALHSYILYIST
uniref:Uncharacterized protein n=1 Tax=Helianthus annuus TaxID=4232 RepID=A0A251US99_HELAN